MAKFHQPGEAIEGLEISGQSRDPIRYSCDKKINNKKCHVYKAEFNVSAKVDVALANEEKLLSEASSNVNDDISCDTAVIMNTDKHRYKQDLISNATATHGTNKWRFKKQTNVKIITPRANVINAINKRNMIASSNLKLI
jgi:hypothetical protein